MKDKLIEKLEELILLLYIPFPDADIVEDIQDLQSELSQLKSEIEKEKKQSLSAREWLKLEGYPDVMVMTFDNLVSILNRFKNNL
jgi:benzoyl-CoA reductase/2-hydroxyglutaryl-CoA dehydratase subunit BcrC/BadD/HgdB